MAAQKYFVKELYSDVHLLPRKQKNHQYCCVIHHALLTKSRSRWKTSSHVGHINERVQHLKSPAMVAW